MAVINICGGNDTFPGVLGSTVCKVFDFCVGRTGVSETEARRDGLDVETVLSPAPDKAHYMPAAKTLMMKLDVERGTRKLRGAQTVVPGDGSKRIDVSAMAITAGMTVDQLDKVDLCFAPPYAPAIDNLITAADVARNKLDGQMDGIALMDVYAKLQRGEDFIFLDVRSPEEYPEVQLPGTINIRLGALRQRLEELEREKEIIAFCKTSLRGYEAALILKAAGFDRVRVLDGGIAIWPYERLAPGAEPA